MKEVYVDTYHIHEGSVCGYLPSYRIGLYMKNVYINIYHTHWEMRRPSLK